MYSALDELKSTVLFYLNMKKCAVIIVIVPDIRQRLSMLHPHYASVNM